MSMHYVSTRGAGSASDDSPKTFCDILLEGLAPDGGLYLPTTYPMVIAPYLSDERLDELLATIGHPHLF